MAAIAQLKAVLGMDSKQFKAGVAEAEGRTKRFQDRLSSMGRSLAGAFSVVSIVRATKGLVDFASSIRHTADNLGVTTDELQGLNATALKSGVAVDALTKALAKIKDAQGNLRAGGEDAKRYADALAAMGLSQKKFIQAGPAEALALVGRAYSEAGESTEAFSAISDILGERIGPRLISMLRELGDDGLQGVIDKAKEAGMVIEDELITKLELLGTRAEQTKLRVQVGFAYALDRIATGTDQSAQIAGRMSAGDSFDEAVNDTAAAATRRDVAIQNAIDERKKALAGGSEIKRPGVDAAAHVEAYKANQKMQAKVDAENKRYAERMRVLQEQSINVNPTGRDINRSSASMGAIFGGPRSGVAIADRQLRIAQEHRDITREIKRELEKHTEALAAIAEREGGAL